MARAQSVLLQQRSRVLQRTLFRRRHLSAPARAREDRYPGDHDWLTAARYYFAAGRLVAGVALDGCWRGAGVTLDADAEPGGRCSCCHCPRRSTSGACIPPSTPIFVPDLPPYSWYNTRYAIAVVPLAAFARGAVVKLLPMRFQVAAALVLTLGTTAAWALSGLPSISWKESEMNSEARRDWTAQAAGIPG